MYEPLNLPPFDILFKRDRKGALMLFDPLRRKYVVATPEEWVRQHFVNYLIEHLGYPGSFIANEVGITLNSTKRRCDTLIYSRDLKPLCIVEYKQPSIPISEAVFDQIARYNIVLEAPFLIVSNGLKHYCCQFDGQGYKFLSSIPTYEEMSCF